MTSASHMSFAKGAKSASRASECTKHQSADDTWQFMIIMSQEIGALQSSILSQSEQTIIHDGIIIILEWEFSSTYLRKCPSTLSFDRFPAQIAWH